MARHGKKRRAFGPLVLIGLAAAVLSWSLTDGGAPALSMDATYERLFLPLLRLLCFLGVGLLVGQVVESAGWTARIAVLARPLMRWGRLGDESGAAFTTAFFSATTANAMLMTYHQEGKLSRRELWFSYLVNTGLPVFLLHLPTTFFIIVPITRSAGAIYLTITFLAALLKSIGLLLFTRLVVPSRARGGAPVEDKPREGMAAGILGKFRRRFSRVVLYAVPIYVLIFTVNERGFFDWLRESVAGWVSVSFLPVEAASVVVFSIAAEFTSGIAAAGALLDAGALDTEQTVLALVLGSIVAIPVRAIRHQLPGHAGIFTPRLGLQLLVASQALRVLSLAAVTAVYLVWV